MDRETMINDLTIEINMRLVNPTATPITVGGSSLIVEAIESLGYQIVSKNMTLNSDHIVNFQETIARWLPDDKIEPNDVPGEQVLQSLSSDGWVIVPPNA